MTTRAFLSGSMWLVLAALGVAVVAWNASQAARAATEARAIAVRNEAALAAQAWSWRVRLARVECDAETAREELAELAARAVAEEKAMAPVEAKLTGASMTDPWVRALRRDPVVQALQIAARRGRLEASYAPMFKRLGLGPERAEKFMSNVMALEERFTDLNAAAEAKDLDDNDEAIARLRGRAMKECEVAQRELLGADDYQRVVDFMLTMPVRESVGGLAAVMTAAGVPMTAQQAEQLAEVIMRDGGPAMHDSRLPVSEVDWPQVDRSARAILSEAQLAIFQTTEPNTSVMNSRFAGRLERLIDQAREAEVKAASGAVGGGGR